MKNNDLYNQLTTIFSVDFFDDSFDPEGKETEIAEELLSSYDWSDIYQWFYNHLTQECKTSKEVYNAINLYFVYLFDKKPVPNPYELCGYILYRIDIDKYWDLYGDFTDSFIISILETCGKVNLVENPYYQSWNDENIITEKEKWTTL